MKRKIIHQGNDKHGSYTVTLPVEWVKKYGFKAGDEIDVDENANVLSLVANKGAAVIKKVELDTRGWHIKQIRHRIQQAYRDGAEHIVVKFIDGWGHYKRTGRKVRVKEEIEYVVSVQLLGMEIEKLTNDTAIISQFGEEKEEEFEAAFRRMWFKLPEIVEQVVEIVDTRDESSLSDVRLSDKTIDRFANFCIRVLNRKSHFKHAKMLTYVGAITRIEMMSELLYLIAIELVRYPKRVKSDVIDYIKDMEKAVKEVTAYFYDHKESRVNELLRIRDIFFDIDLSKRDFLSARIFMKVELIYDLLMKLTNDAAGLKEVAD